MGGIGQRRLSGRCCFSFFGDFIMEEKKQKPRLESRAFAVSENEEQRRDKKLSEDQGLFGDSVGNIAPVLIFPRDLL